MSDHREGFIFYRSFADALSTLDDSSFRTIVDAITAYALDDKEPELDGYLKSIFVLIRPQIDANNRRYENGKKGGRPKKQTETKAKPKQNQSETKNKMHGHVVMKVPGYIQQQIDGTLPQETPASVEEIENIKQKIKDTYGD